MFSYLPLQEKCLDCTVIQQTEGIGLCLEHRIVLSKCREYNRKYVAKWRAANPKKARALTKKHQMTWRTKNPALNRLRAKLGMQKLKEKQNGSST